MNTYLHITYISHSVYGSSHFPVEPLISFSLPFCIMMCHMAMRLVLVLPFVHSRDHHNLDVVLLYSQDLAPPA